MHLAISPPLPKQVNFWISHIRTVRDEHTTELRALEEEEQWDKLVQLNVMQQVHACVCCFLRVGELEQQQEAE